MILLIQCKDRVGLVAAISAILVQEQLNIVSMSEHVDKAENRFFMRLEVEPAADPDRLNSSIKAVLPEDAVITINPPQKKIVVLVTKEYHCLADILIRNFFGTLGASVLAVIGNYNVLQDICVRFDVPFHWVSYEEGLSKAQAEAKNSRTNTAVSTGICNAG